MLCSVIVWSGDYYRRDVFKVGDLWYEPWTIFEDSDSVYKVSVTYNRDLFKAPSLNDYELYTHVEVPATVEHNDTVYIVADIGWGAFRNCISLESITLPNTCTSISQEGFTQCRNLRSIEFPECFKGYGSYAFSGTGITELVLPDSVDGFDVSRAVDITFGDNIPDVSPRYMPRFYGYVTPGDVSTFRAHEMETLILPKSHFAMFVKAFDRCKYGRVVLPDIPSLFSEDGAFYKCQIGEFVSMGKVPPEFEDADINVDKAPFFIYPEDTVSVQSSVLAVSSQSPRSRHTWPPTPETYPTGMFDSYEGLTLVVPAGSEDAYRAAPVWCEFPTIKGVDNIDEYIRTPFASIGDTLADCEPEFRVESNGSGVTITAGRDVTVTVCTVMGQTVLHRQLSAHRSLHLALTPGFYIIKGSSTVVKTKV